MENPKTAPPAGSSPPGDISLIVRCKEGLFHARPGDKEIIGNHIRLFLPECIESDFSPDGQYIMGFNVGGQFFMYKVDDGSVVHSDYYKDMSNCYFSPDSHFAVVTHGSGKETKSTIYKIGTTEKITIENNFMKSLKRYVVFLINFKMMVVQIAPNLLEMFNVANGFTNTGKLEIIPSGDIGAVQNWPEPLLYAINDKTIKEGQNGVNLEFYRLKTGQVHYSHFFAGIQQLDMFLNPKGHQLLMRMHKYVDESGESYYGKNSLTMMHLNEKKLHQVACVKGPIYDVKWNPRGDSFAVCSGMMPSFTTIYDDKAEPFLVVLKDKKNSIFWSPNGDFIAIAGFGNLTGEIQIWNVATKKFLGKCTHADAGDLEWAPDGRHFVTKVEFKFLREGNQYRVYNYHGTLVTKVDFRTSQLNSVRWFTKGTLLTRALSPAPPKPKPIGASLSKGKDEEDFMAEFKEKSSGPFKVTKDEILWHNSGARILEGKPIQDPTKAKDPEFDLVITKAKKKKKK